MAKGKATTDTMKGDDELVRFSEGISPSDLMPLNPDLGLSGDCPITTYCRTGTDEMTGVNHLALQTGQIGATLNDIRVLSRRWARPIQTRKITLARWRAAEDC
jgi:hypothetical protein